MSMIEIKNEIRVLRGITIALLLWNFYITGTAFSELIQMIKYRGKMHEDYGREITDILKELRKQEITIYDHNKQIWSYLEPNRKDKK